jgi:hypothetical protein
MSDDRKDLPPVSAPNFNERLRETISTYLGNRGNKLDRGVTLRDLVDGGLVKLRSGFLAGSGGSASPIGGAGTAITDAYEPDLTPPPTPTGFTASTSKTSIQVVTGAQSYTQGHGHAKTIVYGVKYTGGALPTFSSAVVIDEFSGTVNAFAVDPASDYRLWVKWVSKDGVVSEPAGGTNGVTAVAGLLDDVNIASLTASKLTAGTVSALDIKSSGTTVVNSVAVPSWSLNGSTGLATFNNVVVRGTVYATTGLIGGNTIDSTGLQSPGYSVNVAGWRLGSDGQIRAFSGGGSRVLDMSATGTSPAFRIGSAFEVLGNGTATFAGALSAVTGTFAGTLSAATGTFAGSLSAGVVDINKLIGSTATYSDPGQYTLTVPAEFTSMRVTLIAGGGGGGSGMTYNTNGGGGGGGGAGGLVIATYSGLTSGAQYTLVVGSGGAGGPWPGGYGQYGSAGAAGGATVINGVVAAYGGGGGGESLNPTGGAGGTPVNGTNYNGAAAGDYNSYTPGGNGGSGLYGTGGTGGVYSSVATQGTGYGAGGGGGQNHISGIDISTAGGRGAGGRAIIEFFNPNGVVIRSEFASLLNALQRQGIATV